MAERKKVIKLSSLEKDLLLLISKGKNPNWFAAAHNISTRTINYSVERLTTAGIIERIVLSGDDYALTEVGYERLKKAFKNFKLIDEETKPTEKKELLPAKPENTMTYIDGDKNQIIKMNTKNIIKPVQINNEENQKPESILDKVLEEKNNRRQQTRTTSTMQKAIPIRREIIQTKKIEQPESTEKCELCKGKFSTSVSDVKNRMYGHCFCGASYHEECYNTIITTDQKCFRCSRKLKEINDKAVEAVKDIKEVFE